MATQCINFARGHPNKALLPIEEMTAIFQAMTSENLHRCLNYPKVDSGDPRFVAALRSFLDRHTQTDTLGSFVPPTKTDTKTDFFITHGVSHALEMLCSVHTSPGDLVMMEEPTYFLAANIFKSHGLEIQTLPMKSSGGVDIEQLEQGLQSGELSCPSMIYTIPTHQNPTGRTMPIDDRWKLARLSRQYDILVAADEVYHLLDWRNVAKDGPRPARMALIDQYVAEEFQQKKGRGCCVSISSFTKIFAPGVRCGWVEGPPHMADSLANLGYVVSQGGCAPLIGELLYTSISQGLSDEILENLTTAFSARAERMVQRLSTEPGIHLEVKPIGGYFVWVQFLGIGDTTEFAKLCESKGVRILPGSRCSSQPSADQCSPCARLCFADLDLEDIDTGIDILIASYREFLTSANAST